MIRSRFVLFVGAAVLGLSALAACGGSDDKPVADKPVAEKPAAEKADTKAEPCVPSDLTLTTSTIEGLGTIVVDGDCRTAYTFDKDTASPPTTNCDDKCALTWTPVPQPSGGAPLTAAEGVGKVGLVARAGGKVQLTLNGWPLYYNVTDEKPGDVNGHAVNDDWWVTDPQGVAILKRIDAASSVD